MTWSDLEGCTGSKNGNPPAGGTCACTTRRRRLASEIMAFLNLRALPSMGVDFHSPISLDEGPCRDPRGRMPSRPHERAQSIDCAALLYPPSFRAAPLEMWRPSRSPDRWSVRRKIRGDGPSRRLHLVLAKSS